MCLGLYVSIILRAFNANFCCPKLYGLNHVFKPSNLDVLKLNSRKDIILADPMK